ncbi:MAG: rRNA ((1405)-N(7))-methyltransferase, partial [Candidatus Poribacteria bacterium]|nr:rRNA ((1405)-N(7))-methyltransferase [Candidatus Poribacteria bacterium]
YNQKPDYKHILNKFVSNVNNGGDAKQEILKLISIQSSTRERIPILDDFYGKIFTVTGRPSSVIEHACGFNPLTTLWMDLPENAKYQAFDIENDLIDFLKSVIDFLNISDRIEIRQGDVLVDEFGYSDIVFMMKFLPVLEQQQKGSSIEVMQRQNCKYMVVTFPVKSMSGVEKGMSDFYSNWFKNLIKDEDWQYDEILYNTELVFVVQKE